MKWIVIALLLLLPLQANAGEKGEAAQKSAAQKSEAAQKSASEAAQKGEAKSSWQKIAEQRAATMAARRHKGHLPGVPNCFEGVGWSTSTPNCATCVGSGLLADAVARGSDGYYRVRLYASGGSTRYTVRARRGLFRRR